MMRKKKSHNRIILDKLLNKSRRIKTTPNISYPLLYAFLYKYLSDNLKHHLLEQIGGEGDDLKTFYLIDEQKEFLREIALNDLGYFINSYDAYIDSFNDYSLVDYLFSPRFFKILQEHIEFGDDSSKEYFGQIIEILNIETRFYRLIDQEDIDLLLNDFLFSVMRLNVFEEEFSYAQVYDLIASSRVIGLSRTPEYILNLLCEIISSQKSEALNIYDPFMKDASTLTTLKGNVNIQKYYGKEDNARYYYYSLIKAFIEGFDFKNTFFFRQNAIESMSIDNETFDIILSKVPNRFRDLPESMLKKQSLEIPNKREYDDFKEKLLLNFDMDKLSDDKQALDALKVLEERMSRINESERFYGEYESLSGNEFLFIINMINSLKEDGIMLISVSQNFLFKNSLTTLRKFLTYENNYIDAIISLPEGLSRSIRPEVVIVFKKNKNTDDILFIDISKEYETEKSRNAIRGTSRRNLILSKETIRRIVDVYSRRRTVDKFSEVIKLRELEKNDFNLTVSRYVDTYEGDFIQLDDLTGQKEEIASKVNELNDKIEKMLQDLNIGL